MIQSVELDLLFYFCLSSILFSELRDHIHTRSVHRCTDLCFVLSLCCSIFKDRMLTFRSWAVCRFPRQLWYYTTDLSVCQYFFWIFLKKFSFSRFKQQEQNLVSTFVQFEQLLENWVPPYIIYKGRNPLKEVRRCFTWSTADIFSRLTYQY